MEDEKWAPVKYFYDYEISNLGNIRRNKGRNPGKPLKVRISKQGYKTVSMLVAGKEESRQIHRLVAFAFVQKTDPNQGFVRFKDGDKTNCRADNLEWAKKSWLGGYKDPAKTEKKGPDYLAALIRSRKRCHWSDEAIANFYNVSLDTVRVLLATDEAALPRIGKVPQEERPLTDRILSMGRMHWRPHVIAKRLGIPVRQVRETLKMEETEDGEDVCIKAVGDVGSL